MLQFGEYFEYNDRNSTEFNLKIVRIDNIEIPVGLGREIVKGSTNFYRKRPSYYGTSYIDDFSFDIHFIKDPCKGETPSFTKDEIRRINAWLTSPSIPKKFHMYNYEEENSEEYDYYGLFTNIEYAINDSSNWGGPAAITATFTCDSSYGWVNKTQVIESVNDSSTIAIDVIIDSDELEEYIYPLLYIEPDNISGSGTRNFILLNKSDQNNQLQINVSDNHSFYIDSKKMKIYDSIGLMTIDDLGIEDVGSFYLPRLVNGVNHLEISGQCKVTIFWEEPRKVGAY